LLRRPETAQQQQKTLEDEEAENQRKMKSVRRRRTLRYLECLPLPWCTRHGTISAGTFRVRLSLSSVLFTLHPLDSHFAKNDPPTPPSPKQNKSSCFGQLPGLFAILKLFPCMVFNNSSLFMSIFKIKLN